MPLTKGRGHTECTGCIVPLPIKTCWKYAGNEIYIYIYIYIYTSIVLSKYATKDCVKSWVE